MTIASAITDPQLWLLVLAVTALGLLSKLVYYNIGRKGVDYVLERIPSITIERWQQVENRYAQSGSKVLFFSSVPGVGSVITAAAGVLGIELHKFIFWVLISTLIRNWILVLFFGGAISLLPFT